MCSNQEAQRDDQRERNAIAADSADAWSNWTSRHHCAERELDDSDDVGGDPLVEEAGKPEQEWAVNEQGMDSGRLSSRELDDRCSPLKCV